MNIQNDLQKISDEARTSYHAYIVTLTHDQLLALVKEDFEAAIITSSFLARIGIQVDQVIYNPGRYMPRKAFFAIAKIMEEHQEWIDNIKLKEPLKSAANEIAEKVLAQSQTNSHNEIMDVTNKTKNTQQ